MRCLAAVIGIEAVLRRPPDDRAGGEQVRRELYAFLDRAQAEAPQRGRGACYRRFLEHVRKTADSYAAGLFHCYDDRRIPQTSNAVESQNGAVKLNLRRCRGQASTAAGPGTSCARAYTQALLTTRSLPAEELHQLVTQVPAEAYRRARAQLEADRAPSARRRSLLRAPSRGLAAILDGWKNLLFSESG